jgi:hypothetical protein
VDEPFNDPVAALGPVTGYHRDVVSLGDLDSAQLAASVPSGRIVLGFDTPIRDGSGADFAVFENGFLPNSPSRESLVFAELAFVDVSSDGVNFARFRSRFDTTFAQFLDVGQYTRPRHVYNLAGKHMNNHGNNSTEPSEDPSELIDICFGTPFDLADLANDPLVVAGLVDLGRIAYVRIVDIPGNGSVKDSRGQPVYDPWLTTNPLGNGGFDLEAIGVLNAALPGTTDRYVSLSWTADRRLVGDPTAAQDLDLDNDGQTAWEEFFAGTDPNDPNSFLHVLNATPSNGTVTVAWQGGSSGSDIDFTLQRRASLTEGDWTDAEVNVPRAQGNIQSWQDETPGGDGAFFRVLVKAPDPVVN